MSVKEEIVIKDSCILFDLLDLFLIEDFFQLGLKTFTTKQVMAEVTDENQLIEISKYIQSGELIIDGFGSEDIITSINNESPGLSYADASVLELALRIKAVILSADKSLRNESQRRGLTVRGVLWIIDELYNKNILTKEKALDKLITYPKVNSRAPINEIEKMVSKFTDNKTINF